MADVETVNQIYDAIINALDEVSKTEAFTRGEVMSAMVRLLVATGLCEPKDTVHHFKKEVDQALKNAISEWLALPVPVAGSKQP